MNAARQISRRFGRTTEAQTRSASADCIVRTVSFWPDPLKTAILRNLPALYFALRKAGIVQHDWFDDQVAFLEYLSSVIDKKVSGK